MRLWELRKEPTKNVKKSTADSLLQYANDAQYYVSFSPIKKIGIYPQSDWDTPNGVYAYPIRQYKTKLQYVEHKVDKVFPYGAERPYVFIIKNTASNPLNFDKELPPDVFERCVEIVESIKDPDGMMLGAYENYEDMAKQRKFATRYPINSQQIYYVLRQATLLGFIKTNQFNRYLRLCGFDAVIDNGHGVLHSGLEPIQACFLTPSSYDIVDLLYNDTMAQADKHFYYGAGERTRKPETVNVGSEVLVIGGPYEFETGVVMKVDKTKGSAMVQIDYDSEKPMNAVIALTDLQLRNG
jgi:hypothetical protein